MWRWGVALLASLLLESKVACSQSVTIPMKMKYRGPAGFQGSKDYIHLDARGRPILQLDNIRDMELAVDADGNVKNAAVAVEKLGALNPILWAYFASLNFHGNQTVDVLIDTGSAAMGVPTHKPSSWDQPEFQLLDEVPAGATRVMCSDDRCRGKCKDSPTEGITCSSKGGYCRKHEGQDYCSFLWMYGDGSNATGLILESAVELGGLWFNTTYGGIMDATKNFFESPKGGGIMGLSLGNNSICPAYTTCLAPVIDDLIAQNGLDDKFAICASGNDSALVVGRGDRRLHAAPVQYVELQPPFRFYRVNVHDVKLGSESLITPPKQQGNEAAAAAPAQHLRRQLPPANSIEITPGPMSALIDTGNSATIIPKVVFQRMQEELMKHLKDDRLAKLFDHYAVFIPPETLQSMPPLHLILDNNVTITIPADQYMYDVPAEALPVKQPFPVHLLMFYSRTGDDFILGETVLRHLYMEFDRGAKTVGFAPAAKSCILD